MNSKLNRVFVYGTLKSGQIRESMWPHSPIEILPMKTRGRLYDLGPYPAMTTGDDWVLGEVWRFDFDQMPATLETLDAIEGYQNAPSDLYRRVIVTCVALHAREAEVSEESKTVEAYTFHYVQSLADSDRIAIVDGLCRWPA